VTLPDPLPGTVLRILGTSDLGATTLPLRTSSGPSGTTAGVVSLLEASPVPAVWLDAGDFVVGNPSYLLRGERPWEDVKRLPIAAAAIGNHDFDDGREAMPELPFPVLCANADADLPPSVLVGELGVIGLTHPAVHELTRAPEPYADWRVGEHAAALRRDGARWVVALLHDGVTWWPDGDGVATRADRLERLVRPWADAVDLILLGHDFAAWSGELAGTPAVQPHLWASSVSVVDLAPDPVVRGVFRVPPVRGDGAAADVLERADADVVAEFDRQWLTRTGAEHYLPDLFAEAFRTATGAGAAFVMPAYHGIQAPFDGAIASLGPGPVTELDLLRPFASPDYDVVVADLRPGELRTALDAYGATADPGNRAGDELAWNWCRMPAGLSVHDESSVAMLAGAAPLLSDWIGREPALHESIPAREALLGAVR
jgi:hypothetical protein